MKLRTTTPASVSLTTRVLLGFIGLLFVVSTPLQITQRVFADHYDDQINALQQEINQYQAASNTLSSQADTLQTALSQLSSQKSTIQAQIDLSQAKYDKLVQQIADTEKMIKDNQDALGVTIANMYVDGKVSPIEMIASSKTISEYLDKQEYQSSIRDQLTSTINKIKDLKTQLNKQKTDVAKILEDQKSQRDQLVAKENEQQKLLNETQGQEAAYQQLIGKNQAAISEVRATQALVNSRFNGSGGYSLVDSGSLGDYPWNSSNCPMWGYLSTGGADGNGGDGHGYGCRQCASFVAWKIAKETGKYYSWGNAVNFTHGATNAGYAAGGPQAGSIAVMDPGTAGVSEGHVAWVEAVNGNSVLISQYNYNYGAGYGMYSEMWLSAGAFDHYVHIR
ncbi:MAG: CHAP domain-containing protein [Candidatus Saccharibacteria bacterium]|nr:CHAP domain-containing protein [Candidatus Saccharibacteria bacterium]